MHRPDSGGSDASSLTRSAEATRAIAMKALAERLEASCEGAVAVDLEARVSWINEKYARKLGLASARQAVGMVVEDLIPNSRFREVLGSGEPIMLDIMDFGDEHFVVTRMPMLDEAGTLMGAIGFLMYDQLEGLKPLMAKFNRLQARLSETEKELAAARRAKYTLASFLGVSAATQEVKRQARRAAQLDSTVLLMGETGSGKELMAHAIHNLSARAQRPFVSVNAAAIPEALLESELFGAAPGAYTGADRRGRDGKFKLAHGGTLFLDEVGDMPLALQAKLLRVLQEQEIEPLGSNKVEKIDVRVIAATFQNLAQAVAEGRFRADLYYRLNVLGISIPPLRERQADLPLLCERILDDVSLRLGHPLELDEAALARLAAYHWPGNVRELRNVLERAVLLFDTRVLGAPEMATVLPPQPAPAATAIPTAKTLALAEGSPRASLLLADAVADAERETIHAALRQCQGNKQAAAAALGISRAALYQKLSVLGLGQKSTADASG